MSKVFLYLYPIREYTKVFMRYPESFYKECGLESPMDILNKCIEERYRSKGYKVAFAMYPDKEMFGVVPKHEDLIITTDISFEDNSAIDENNEEKKDFVPKYPDEKHLLSQLGDIDELVVGGYHFSDCVKRVAEASLALDIPTLVDLDLTDLFFNLYKDDKYFKVDSYDPFRFKEHMIGKISHYEKDFAEKMFDNNYSSPVYGFKSNNIKR